MKGNVKNLGDKITSWLFLVPTLIFLGITALFPLVYSIYLSLFRLKLNLPNQKLKFIGLGNYAKMLGDEVLKRCTLNTIVFAIVSVGAEMLLGLAIAMVISSDKKWSKWILSLLMIPMIMAPVAAGTLWRMMLDSSTGVINYFLVLVGFPNIPWLSKPFTAMVSVIGVNVWQLTPWVTIILAAALKGIPRQTIEAAMVDGASRWQIFTRIIIPYLKPVIIIALMIRIIDAFKVFDTVYVMTGGGPGIATEMLPNFIYRQGLKYFDAGYAAALAIIFIIFMSLVTYGFIQLRVKEQEKTRGSV